MAITITDKQACCGCEACRQRCPKQCITMREDEEGFLYPAVNAELCIDCGLCERVCPLVHPLDALPPLQVVAARNRDDGERMSSSSGGIFIALARETVKSGGVVVGAVYDEEWQVKLACADTIDGMRPMMGSKYVQARVPTAYADCERLLREGRQVMFTGSPCQVAALHAFLRHKSYDGLTTVEYLCHGVPSPGVWRRYIKEIAREKGSLQTPTQKDTAPYPANSLSRIGNIEFRNKSFGWKNYSFVVGLKAAFAGEESAVLRSDIFHRDAYIRGFLADIYLRPSCYGCLCKNGHSHCDITIGDFWGIDRLMPSFDDDRGTSIVIVNSDKGQRLFDRIAAETRPASVADAVPYNGGFNARPRPHPRRKDFFRRYNEGKETIESIVSSLLRVSLARRILRKGKRMARRLMQKMRSRQ